MTDIHKRFADIEPHVHALAQECDDLNERLQDVETRLNSFRAGTAVQVVISSEDTTWWDEAEETESEAVRDFVLCYGKRRGSWGLYIREDVWVQDNRVLKSRDVHDIASASRALRVDALTAVPQLLNEFETNVKRMTEKVRQAKQAVA